MSRTLLLPGDRPLIHLALLGTTLVTCTVGFGFFLGDWRWGEPGSWDIGDALGFSLAAIAILGSHEMGHYIFARIHKVDTTLPYFIPLPFGFGTLGAVIRIKSRIPTRNALVDIGAAGPLAGLAVAIPLILWGLTQSRLDEAVPVTDQFPASTSLLAVLQQLTNFIRAQMDGTWQPEAVYGMRIRFGDSLLMQALTWVVFGPLPAGKEVYVHNTVIAGWFGLLVTMLNLCPIGQLDGGHLSFAMFGKRAQWIGKAMAAVLFGFALFYSASWLLWFALVTKLVGFGHPEVIDPTEPLSFGRKVICILCFVALVLCLLPVPMETVFS